MLPLGEIAMLTGGPTIEFSSFRLTTIFGSSGFARSKITTVSLPVGLTMGFPCASGPPGFSSLPTIMKGAADAGMAVVASSTRLAIAACFSIVSTPWSVSNGVA